MTQAPNINDQEWASFLNEFEGAYNEASEFSDWLPPVGSYTAVVTKATFGRQKDGKTLWWKLIAQLADGLDAAGNSLQGREFTLGFWNSDPARIGVLKSTCRKLAGAAVTSLALADQTIRNSAGYVLRISVTETPSKKNPGAVYTNVRIDEVVSRPTEATA